MIETVDILRLGHAGDGVTGDGRYVRYSAPGDRLLVRREGEKWKIDEIIVPGESRIRPVCRHFGFCGGCALQHIAGKDYLDWKRRRVVEALEQRGFAAPPVEAIRAVPPGTRRRAMFKARMAGPGAQLGFYEAESRTLVDIVECKVLTADLANLIDPLKQALGGFLKVGETAELHVTATDSGVDLSLKLKRPRSPGILMALSALAADLKLARLSWNDEIVAMTAEPSLRIGGHIVSLPPEAFLQPTREGERILQTLVRENIAGAAAVADLFSGCGTFALALDKNHTVHAVDSARAQIEALERASKQGKKKITMEARDLYRRPLLPKELARFDGVILDPPRPGAAAQAETLAASAVPLVLYVSCNPASFARDARILVNGGYGLKKVVPLDQFPWSPHVELFGVFSRR